MDLGPTPGLSIGSGLAGFAEGFANVFAQKKLQEHQEQAREKQNFDQFIIHQAGQGNIPMDDPEVQKRMKAHFGEHSATATAIFEAIAGHNYQIKSAWPKYKEAHGGDPLTAFDAYNADPPEKRDPMVLESLQHEKQDLGVILARPKARESTTGRLEGQQQMEAPWQEHLRQHGGNLKEAYETAPKGMYISPSTQSSYNSLITTGPKAAAGEAGRTAARTEEYGQYRALEQAFPNDPEKAYQTAVQNKFPIPPEVERQHAGLAYAPVKERITRQEKLVTKNEEAKIREFYHNRAEDRRFNDQQKLLVVKEHQKFLDQVRAEQRASRAKGQTLIPQNAVSGMTVTDPQGKPVDTSGGMTYDQFWSMHRNGYKFGSAGLMDRLQRTVTGGSGAPMPQSGTPSERRTQDEEANDFHSRHGTGGFPPPQPAQGP
jgi:hypothetical protein